MKQYVIKNIPDFIGRVIFKKIISMNGGHISLFVTALFGIVVSCGEPRQKETFSGVTGEKQVRQPYGFELPSIPMILSDEERKAFMVRHYWDRFDFADTVALADKDITEQAFADYLLWLSRVRPAVVSGSVDTLLGRALRMDLKDKVKAGEKLPLAGKWKNPRFDYFARQFRHYLYEPDSPAHDDELYLIVLQRMLAMPELDSFLKIRPQYELNRLWQNRVGSRANNIPYVTSSGRKGSLYGLQAEYVLLFFYDPDCNACQQVRGMLASSEILRRMVESKQLVVLALYCGEEQEHWREYMPVFPSQWINAHDYKQKIRHDEIYDLAAVPSLYLLDKDKIVILKNVAYPQLEQYLRGL